MKLLPIEDPVQLAPAVDHGTAPLWFTWAHGQGETGARLFRCPACESTNVMIRHGAHEVYVVDRYDGAHVVPVEQGPMKPDDPQARVALGITVPMTCELGHTWMLCVEQQDGESARLSVLLSDETYATLYPHEQRVWG